MPDTGLALNPDDKPIYEALRAAGTPEDLAYTAVQRIRDVAAANLIAQVMAKLDAQNAQLAALRWLIGGGFALLGLLIAALQLFA